MSGAHRTLQFGPATYEVSAAVTGGQLVAVDTANAGKVKPTAAATDKVLGVAMSDAQAAGTNPTDPLNTAWPQNLVSVGYGPGEYRLTFLEAAAFGDLLCAVAGGQVAKTSDGGTTAATGDNVIGRCTEPGGVDAGATGRVRLYI